MTAVGMFGKLPSFGDFVSMGTGSHSHRAFERWLEDSNDTMMRRGQELSKSPLGFLMGEQGSTSLLVGIAVGSIDSVGRKFPLGLFYELDRQQDMMLSCLPVAMAGDLYRLAGVARKARTRTPQDVEQLLRRLPLPDEREITVRTKAEQYRLRLVKAEQMLRRVYGEGHNRHYSSEVILSACASMKERGTRLPLVLEGHVRTDIELMFTLASVEIMSHGQQPIAALWQVRECRVLIVLGNPDGGLLSLMVDGRESDRLWPMWTDRPEAAERARDKLDPRLRSLLDEPGTASAKDFLDSLAVACGSQDEHSSTPKSGNFKANNL